MELVTYTDHHRSFLGVCENVAVNVRELVIQISIFIVETGDHLLMLRQLFLYKGKFSQQYLKDGVYDHFTNFIKTHTVVFPTLGLKDQAN